MEASPTKRTRRASDRVLLNVGGTTFATTSSTLCASSTYFAALFSREWAEEDDIFLDRDPDAFKILLSCMRNNSILLPERDQDLCARVLLEAEFFGVSWLLRDVKHRALRHEPYSVAGRGSFSGWDPDEPANKDILKDPERAAEKFDELFDGLRGALRTGVLPSRFFKQADPFQDKPVVRQLVPAGPGDRVVFDDGNMQVASARPIAYAWVEEPSGNQYMDAIIASRDPRHDDEYLDYDNQMVLASTYVEQRSDWDNHSWGIVQGDGKDGEAALKGDMPGLRPDMERAYLEPTIRPLGDRMLG